MWGATLSGPLPVFGLVSRYLTNYLMGRRPLPEHYRFPCELLVPTGVWGISTPFEALSPPRGQVTYVLLTRPPLSPSTEAKSDRSTCMY